MAEYIQIIFNVLILGGLALFVFRESAYKYATLANVKGIVEERFAESMSDAENILHELNEHKLINDSVIGDSYIKQPVEEISEIEKMILLGAELTDKAYQAGSKIVLDSLAREGRISHEPRYVHEEKAFNLDEFDVDETLKEEEKDKDGLPPIIAQMNERMGREFAAAGLKERGR